MSSLDWPSCRLVPTCTFGVCLCLHRRQIRSWPNFREKLTVLDGHAKHLGRLGGVTAMATTREEDNKPNKPFTR